MEVFLRILTLFGALCLAYLLAGLFRKIGTARFKRLVSRIITHEFRAGWHGNKACLKDMFDYVDGIKEKLRIIGMNVDEINQQVTPYIKRQDAATHDFARQIASLETRYRDLSRRAFLMDEIERNKVPGLFEEFNRKGMTMGNTLSMADIVKASELAKDRGMKGFQPVEIPDWAKAVPSPQFGNGPVVNAERCGDL